jgi:beta-alanine degradation protein BauB
MKRLTRPCFVAALLCLFSQPVYAQQVPPTPSSGIDPVSVSPDKYKILLENDYVRVVEYSIKPGERDQTHTHPPKASYVVEGGLLRIVPADGASFIDTTKAGDASWSGERAKHFAENVGTAPVRIVLFEIKQIKDRAPVPAEDRALVGPEDVTIKLANDSVRVMEVVLPPGLKEKPHTHPAYVTYVSSGGKVRIHAADGSARDSDLKTGAVFFSERVNHWAEVTGDTTIRVLLVEIRRP